MLQKRRRSLLTLASYGTWDFNLASFSYVYNSLLPNGSEVVKGKIAKIYANGVVENQVLGISTTSSQTINGITFTNNNDGSITISGTASAETTITIRGIIPVQNHKYLLCGCKGGSATTYYLYDANYTNQKDIGGGVIYTYGYSWSSAIVLKILSGTNITTPVTMFPQLIDLTQMSPFDTPTTLTDNRIQNILNRDDIAYNTGSLKSTNVSEIATKDINDNVYSIPFIYQGNGVGTSHDSLQITSSEYVFTKNVSSVDLGSLSWTLQSNYSANTFETYISDMFSFGQSGNVFNGMLCSKYSVGSNVDTISKDKVIGTYLKYIRIRDTNYTSSTDFKTAMSGVYLYYELATPQVIRIPRKHLGIVDLGSLNWTNSANYTNVVETSSYFPNAKKPSGNYVQANIYCVNYITKFYYSGGTGVVSTSLSIGLSASGYIYINDSSLFGKTNAEIQQALSGIYLFYETAEEVDDIATRIFTENGGTVTTNFYYEDTDQLAPLLNSTNWYTNYGTTTYANDGKSCSYTNTSQNNGCGIEVRSAYFEPIVSGHSYLCSMKIKSSDTNNTNVYIQLGNVSSSTTKITSSYQELKFVLTPTGTGQTFRIRFETSASGETGTFDIKDVCYYDIAGINESDIVSFDTSKMIIRKPCEVLPNLDLDLPVKV